MSRNATAFEVPNSEHPDARKPGAYSFIVAHGQWRSAVDGERIGITHACPCGCGGLTALWFRGKGPINSNAWDVTGEWPKATLSPSIGVKYDGAGNGPTNFHWHGYLRAGVFEEC